MSVGERLVALQEEREMARVGILTNAQQAPHFGNWAEDDMGRATATHYIIASMQVPSCMARVRPVHSWKFVKWPKVADAETDAGGQRRLFGQANCVMECSWSLR